MRLPVYLDYLATTPVDPRVAARMAQCLTMDGNFGNPSSRSHVYGWRAEEAVEQARRDVADLVGADPREIVWTSGATEADNLALKGVAHFHRRKGRHIVTSTIEHKAVLDSCRQLETEGFELSYVAPDAGGIVQPAALAPISLSIENHSGLAAPSVPPFSSRRLNCRPRTCSIRMSIASMSTANRSPS